MKRGYSIFAETIADMSWLEVEEAAKQGAVMLVPVGVIEQHGPHLPLATDIYAATLICSLLKGELGGQGILSVIAPPYFFGINEATAMFPGSITIRGESMISVLSDLLVSYRKQGFKRQFLINHHGDPLHNSAIVEAIRLALGQDVDVVWLVGGLVEFAVERALKKASPPLPASAVLKVEASDRTKRAREKLNRSQLHIHAEERETSLIMKWFPELLKREDDIRNLKPVLPDLGRFFGAEMMGKWRELSPLGYIGDPSVASVENAELYACEVRDMAAAIARHLRRD